jgi:hypothetical protein
MSNNASNDGGSIHGGNLSSNTGGSIFGDNNASNEGGSIGRDHHDHDHGDDPVDPPTSTVVGFAAQLPTDGVTLAFPVVHNLGTRDTLEQVWNPLTGVQYLPGIIAGTFSVIHTSLNTTTFLFVAPAPAPGAVRVVIVGVE